MERDLAGGCKVNKGCISGKCESKLPSIPIVSFKTPKEHSLKSIVLMHEPNCCRLCLQETEFLAHNSYIFINSTDMKKVITNSGGQDFL